MMIYCLVEVLRRKGKGGERKNLKWSLILRVFDSILEILWIEMQSFKIVVKSYVL